VVCDTGEARVELDAIVLELQALRRGHRKVEHDLAVLDIGGRHFDAGAQGIDDDVRRVAAVTDPLVHRPQQVRSTGHGATFTGPALRHQPALISISASDRLPRNDGRANRALAYLASACAWGGRSIS